MDPLSITASIIAVLQLTNSLLSYLNDIRSATADQKRLAIEASHFASLLTSLRFRVEDARTDDDWFTHVKMLGVKDGPLDQLQAVLERMAVHASISSTSQKRDRVKSALLWKFTKSDVEAAMAQMERLMWFINIALSNDAFKLAQATHGVVVEIGSATQELRLNIEQLQDYATQDVQNKLSAWLQVPDPTTNYYAALKKRQSGTGSWLLTAQAFRDWKCSDKSLFWLAGKPGCGKTILSAAVLENVLADTSNQPDIVVGYFYFDFNNAQKQSLPSALRALVYQLALQLPDGFQALKQLHFACNSGQQQPQESQIYGIFINLIEQAKLSYFFLDALDECKDRDDLLTVIENLCTLSNLRLRVFVTSRRERDIEASLASIADHIIGIDNALVNTDIDLYVRARLDNERSLQKWPASVKQEIVNVLMKKANGMFRWIHCQLDTLGKCHQLRALRAALEDLPKDLDETYARILQDIESRGQMSSAVTVLRWLCFARRPLQLSELVDVLAIGYRDDEPCEFDPTDRMPEPDDIMDICSALISFHNNEQDLLLLDTEEQSNRLPSPTQSSNQPTNFDSNRTIWVRLAHFSVKEYLLSSRCQFHPSFQPGACHVAIGQSCLYYLRYLSCKDSLSDELLNTYPLADYAAQSWWLHIKKAETVDSTLMTTTTTQSIHDFLSNRQELLTWKRIYNIDTIARGGNKRQFQQTSENLSSPLYYASLTGLSTMVNHLTSQGANVNDSGGNFGTALQAASVGGHAKVVRLLIDAGANPDAGGGFHGTALYAASYEGHVETIRVLLELGAKHDTYAMMGGYALQAAAMFGHKEAVKVLLEAGADVNGYSGGFGTALEGASFNGSNEVVCILLNAGADVNLLGGSFGSALHAAASRGWEETIHALLDKGADVNAQAGQYRTALVAASSKGHAKAVQILLDAGADANIYGGKHVSALQAALTEGHGEVVQILEKAGAILNPTPTTLEPVNYMAKYLGWNDLSKNAGLNEKLRRSRKELMLTAVLICMGIALVTYQLLFNTVNLWSKVFNFGSALSLMVAIASFIRSIVFHQLACNAVKV